MNGAKVDEEYITKDPYKILGLDPKDKPDKDTIKSAYRKKAMEFHPDHLKKNKEDVKENSDEFKDINWAYKLLSDDRQRERYDRYGFLEPDTSELKQGVQSTIRAYLNQMIGRGEEVFGLDLITQLTGFCKAQILVAKKEMLEFKKKENHLRKVMSKFRKKKKLSYDFVANYFIEEINNINQSITTRLTTIRILEETIIVVNSYEFEVDQSIIVNRIVPDKPNQNTTQGVNLGNIFEAAARARTT